MIKKKYTSVREEPAACPATAEGGIIPFYGRAAIQLFFYRIFERLLQFLFVSVWVRCLITNYVKILPITKMC